MKPIKICLLLTLLFYAPVSRAQTADRVTLDVHTGYQQENLRWSIAGNIQGQNPNVYSELKWRNLGGTVAAANIGVSLWRGFSFTGGYSRSFIHTGKANDTDYRGDDRTNPVYNQNFDDNKGYSDAWNLGLAYMLFNNNKFSLRPQAGYTQSRQSLYLLDQNGQYTGLNSTYATNWKGPFIKLTSTYKLTPKLLLKADLTYNQVTYNASADWNLINQFKHPISYTHHAKGYGINAGAYLQYRITDVLSVNVGGGYFNWQTGNGTDQLYLTNGQVDVTQMNGVYRNGYNITAGLGLKF